METKKLHHYLIDAEKVYLSDSIEKYSTRRGTYYREIWFVERKEDNIKEVWYVELETIYPKDIYKPHNIINAEVIGIKTEIIRFLEETEWKRRKACEYLINDEFTFALPFNIRTLSDIPREIAKACFKHRYLASFNSRHFQEYLDIKLHEYHAKHSCNPEPCLISKSTGWNDDCTMFFHYDLNDEKHRLSKENTLYKYNKAESYNQAEQHELVYKLLQEGKLLGALLVISVSSILLKPFELQPLTCVITGSYDVDRTGASLIATSLFYKSDDIIMEGKVSSLQFDIMLSSLNSLPFVIDRNAIMNNSMDIRTIIFSVASGMGKTRATRNQTVDTKEFRSNAFLIADEHNLDGIKTSGAAFRRMLHLKVNKWEQFTSLFDINDLKPYEFYSGCGVDYIKYAMSNLDRLKERFEQETKNFHGPFAPISLNIYAGIIMLEEFYTRYYNKQVSFTSLRKKVNDIIEKAKLTFDGILASKKTSVTKLK